MRVGRGSAGQPGSPQLMMTAKKSRGGARGPSTVYLIADLNIYCAGQTAPIFTGTHTHLTAATSKPSAAIVTAVTLPALFRNDIHRSRPESANSQI